MFHKFKNQKKSKVLHTSNVIGTILGALLGIFYGYKLGGWIGAIAGVWFVSVIVGLIFYGLTNIVCRFLLPDQE